MLNGRFSNVNVVLVFGGTSFTVLVSQVKNPPAPSGKSKCPRKLTLFALVWRKTNEIVVILLTVGPL